MKTIIQLAVAGLIINASFQTARVYWGFYQFKDEIQGAALYGREATTSQMHQRVIEIAAEYGITLEWKDVVVESGTGSTSIEATYEKPIPFAPGYSRPWPFKAAVSVRRVRPLTIDDAVKN